MRAALLPTPGDPFMLAYWLRNYETWRHHVDELLVYVNGPLDPDVLTYDQRVIEAAGGTMIYAPVRLGHDGAILRLLERTTADLVVLCEDDAYVRDPVSVRWAFDYIAAKVYDIIGSPRHEDYATSPLYDWDGDPYEPGGLGELRHGLWPAFLFARRDDLLATDRQFGDRSWRIGEEVKGWGVVTPEACEYVGIAPDYIHLDTLFGTTFQLRAAGLRTQLVHHVRLFDAAATEQWLAEDPPWFHVTGLSTLDYVMNDQEPPEPPLWPRRLAWWLRTLGIDPTDEAWDRAEVLWAFCKRWSIPFDAVQAWEDRFERWVNW